MMKTAVFLVSIGICFGSCDTIRTSKNSEVQSTLELSIRSDLEHLKFDFYQDSSGKIYHRVIDLTSGEGIEGIYRYKSEARLRPKINSEYTMVELSEIVDLETFKESKGIDTTGRTLYFEDANYSYILYSVAEGATFDIYPL